VLKLISYESFPRTKIMKLGKANLRKVSTNSEIYMKNPEGKKSWG